MHDAAIHGHLDIVEFRPDPSRPDLSHTDQHVEISIFQNDEAPNFPNFWIAETQVIMFLELSPTTTPADTLPSIIAVPSVPALKLTKPSCMIVVPGLK